MEYKYEKAKHMPALTPEQHNTTRRKQSYSELKIKKLRVKKAEETSSKCGDSIILPGVVYICGNMCAYVCDGIYRASLRLDGTMCGFFFWRPHLS